MLYDGDSAEYISPFIDKSREEQRGRKRRSRKIREHVRDYGAYRSGLDKVSN